MKPEREQTPQEIMAAQLEAFAQMVILAPEIARVKRSFYKAYIEEGFSPQEAVELCKNVTLI